MAHFPPGPCAAACGCSTRPPSSTRAWTSLTQRPRRPRPRQQGRAIITMMAATAPTTQHPRSIDPRAAIVCVCVFSSRRACNRFFQPKRSNFSFLYTSGGHLRGGQSCSIVFGRSVFDWSPTDRRCGQRWRGSSMQLSPMGRHKKTACLASACIRWVEKKFVCADLRFAKKTQTGKEGRRDPGRRAHAYRARSAIAPTFATAPSRKKISFTLGKGRVGTHRRWTYMPRSNAISRGWTKS